MQYVDGESALYFVEKIHQRQFLLKEIGIPSLLFNQWKRYGLIDPAQGVDSRKWTKVDFGDYIWLRIINDLRKFGVPVEDIKRLKNLLLMDAMKEALKNPAQLELAKQTIYETARQQAKLQNVDPSEWIKELDKLDIVTLLKMTLPKQMNLLEALIYNTITVRSESYILLFLTDYLEGVEPQNLPSLKPKKEGKRKKKLRTTTIEFFPYCEEWVKLDIALPDINKFLEVPYLKLPMRTYIKDFITQKKFEKQVEEYGLLSKEEMVLLKEVRKANVKEITIRFGKNQSNGETKIIRIETTTEEQIKAPEARLLETFTSNEYAEIAYQVQNGKMVCFQKTTKIKTGN